MDNQTKVQQALAANASAPNYWNPTDRDYQVDTTKDGTALFVLAILTFVAFLCFGLVRLVCCTCCGKGCCARNKRPVTNKVVALNLILCAIPILMTFVGGALLMSTAKPVRRSLNNFVDTGLNQLDLVRNDVKNVTASVQAALPPEEKKNIDISPLLDADKQLDEAYTTVQQREKDVRRYLNIVKGVIWVAGTCALVLGIWGLITLAARRSPFMSAFVIAAALFGPACWILAGVGFVTREITKDSCNMMLRHYQGDLNPWVLQQARCKELADARVKVDPLMEGANVAVGEANKGLAIAQVAVKIVKPNDPPLQVLCVPFTNSTGVWAKNNDTEAGCFDLSGGEQAVRDAYGDNVCQKDIPPDADPTNQDFVGCVLQGQPIKKPEHEKLLQAGRSVQAVTKALPQVTLLTQCGFVDRAFEAITREDCPDVKRDFNRMTAAATLCALGIILASLYFCVCFRNLRHRRYHPGSKDDPEVNP